MIQILSAYFKLVYLYLIYWLVGLTEETFQYKKAVYLTEVGSIYSAIHALKKAEKELKTGYVYGLLGWCYIQVEAFDKALIYYKKAQQFEESKEILLGLAVSECHAGSMEESKRYVQLLKPYSSEPILASCLARLQVEYERRSSL